MKSMLVRLAQLAQTAAVSAVFVGLPGVATAADYHHMHMTAPDAKEAVAWYGEHMGCEGFGRENACRIGDVQLIWFERPPTDVSVGSGINHIGFSFPDLEAKMTGWQAAGLNIENPDAPIRDVPGLFKLAFLTDPWGARLEVVEDAEWPGFHHIHLASADPAAALTWYQNIFGGERDKLKGRIDGVRYGGVWLVAAEHPDGAPAPSKGRAIDHLSWGFADLDAAAVDIKGKGVPFDMEPRPYTNPLGQEMKISFVYGPDDVWIEVVQPG
jgi:catechol 2,3-dioxygenase-like lactoylglutathione lyase family enzyme